MPHFAFIICRGDQISDELLIYHALLTLESCIDRPWELVVDFTHTTLENRFSVSKKEFLQRVPKAEGSVVEWLRRQTRNPGVADSSSALTTKLELFSSRYTLVQLLGHAF